MPKATATGQRQNYKSKTLDKDDIVRVVARPVISYGYRVDHPDFAAVTWHDVTEERARANVRASLARRFGGMNVEVVFDE